MLIEKLFGNTFGMIWLVVFMVAVFGLIVFMFVKKDKAVGEEKQNVEVKEEVIEEIVENNIRDEEIRKAISTLSDIQKRRIIKYYFEEKTEYEIAKEENATQQSVHIGLERAKEKLKEILKNFKF